MMGRIGRNFIFYSTYLTEMNTFYYQQKYSELPKKMSYGSITEDIDSIGKAAGEEADKLFKNIGNSLENIMKKSGYSSLRSTMRDDWGIKIWVWRANSRAKGAKGRMQIGVYLESNKNNQGVIRPWVWVPGGRSSAEEVRDILGTGSIDGSIYLKDIPIPQFTPDRDFEEEPIVKKVNQAFGPVVDRGGPENLDSRISGFSA